MSMFSNGFTHGETGARVLSDLSTLAHALGVQTNDFENLMTTNEDLELDARLAWKYGCSRAIHSTPMVMINDVLLNVQNPENLTYEQWMSIISDLLN
ncbi:uncharacterized protein LOC124287005 isoform X2 [Haliotis rubra]|uniref:uncharacterized protein LOC124287005 isoform X2 n=1 Tax=Haliotis rubra TaxID=36100 RepID=UPI001EE55575|nr:uncharacterized protein LOC124287005 isoform X2 [Haliotis rubra]